MVSTTNLGRQKIWGSELTGDEMSVGEEMLQGGKIQASYYIGQNCTAGGSATIWKMEALLLQAKCQSNMGHKIL
jgi:hypothetical protein